MTTLQKSSRANFIRQRRTTKDKKVQAPQHAPAARSAAVSKPTTQTARQSYRPSAVSARVQSHRIPSYAPNRTTKTMNTNGYDLAFSIGGTAVHAPTLTLPRLGSRWISAALTLLLTFILFTFWNASAFSIHTAVLRGSQRLTAADVNAALGDIGQPVFKAVPAVIEAHLRDAFSDLASVHVTVGFPNKLTVNVVERVPLLAWNDNGILKWIDANGMAFTPRGDVPGLLQVAAAKAPAMVLDPATPLYQQKFIDPQMVQALITLAPVVPAGMPMTYDSLYGIGWQDPRGWSVYFGQDTKDISMKLAVYQAIVDTLSRQGIQPTLISVEYLNAPFYK
jgi:cell division protein FtsQ